MIQQEEDTEYGREGGGWVRQGGGAEGKESGGGDGGGEHRWTPQLVQAKLLLPAGVRQ